MLAALITIVGERHCLTGAEAQAPFLKDWRGLYLGRARAVVQPNSTQQVQAILRLCHQHRVPVVPQSGNTGLSGGATPDASGNAIVLSVQDRVREHAVLQTLGYAGNLIARLIVVEGMIVGLIGGVIGTVAAVAIVHFGNFSLSTEGLSVPVIASASGVVVGLILSATLGVVAGLVPAWQASRREITQAFRAV